MKAKELIEKLQEFDPEMEVQRNDSEYGAEAIEDIRVTEGHFYTYTPEYKTFDKAVVIS